MSIKIIISRFFLFFLLWSMFFIQAQERKAAEGKALPQKAISSLIRMDLLPKEGISPSPPERDIFSPYSTFNELARTPSGREEGGRPSSITSGGSAEENLEPGLSWVGHSLTLRYIGYVHSPQKTVALIFLGGLALAVEEGDLIEAEVRVEKITPEELVVVGPNGEKRSLSLEGEKS